MQWLKDTGAIRAQVALYDARKLGVDTTVFVAIRTNQRIEKQAQRSAQMMCDMPEVAEVYRMSGEMDYLPHVAVAGIEGYDRAYKHLVKSMPLSDVNSSFSMKQIKYLTTLPVQSVGRGDRGGFCD